MPETIGLDIGSHSIKLVGLKMTSKGPFLTHLGIREIPSGRDKDDANSISEILKSLLVEIGLKTKKVRLVVSGSGVQVKRITIPSIPKGELKEAVRWEIKNYLPYPVETAEIDFHILEEYVEDNVNPLTPQPEGRGLLRVDPERRLFRPKGRSLGAVERVKKLDLIAVVCPKHLIERTLSIAEGGGLQPVHLDVAPFVLWNALVAWDRYKKEETVALIDLGAEKTGIHLFKDGILQFSREVTPAGADITRAIMEGISPEKESNVYECAERIKQDVGIPAGSHHETMVDESIDLSKMAFLIRPVLEKLTSEIGRSLDYYKTQFNVERIDRLLLTGGGANLKNIPYYLGNELHLPVEHFNPLKEILFDPFDSAQPPLRVNPEPPARAQTEGKAPDFRPGSRRVDSKKIDVQVIDQMGSMFTIAFGVALSEPKRIEFLPAKEPFLAKIQIGKLILVLAPLATLLAFLCIIWHMNGQVATLQKERDEKMAKVTRLETLRSKLTLLKEKQESLKQELSLFPSSMIVSVPYREVLREISDIVPNNAVLKLLSVQSKEKSFKKEPQISKPREGESPREEAMGLHLSGVAFGNDIHSLAALALMIERLEKSPLFKNAKLVSATENKLYNNSAAEFEIICDITPDTPPSSSFNPSSPPFLKGGEGGITKGGVGELDKENINP
jgi:type IV pilus assembly protein PilM